MCSGRPTRANHHIVHFQLLRVYLCLSVGPDNSVATLQDGMSSLPPTWLKWRMNMKLGKWWLKVCQDFVGLAGYQWASINSPDERHTMSSGYFWHIKTYMTLFLKMTLSQETYAYCLSLVLLQSLKAGIGDRVSHVIPPPLSRRTLTTTPLPRTHTRLKDGALASSPHPVSLV